jgi:DNA-binding NarL/FixJ family response regulator
MTIRVVVVDDQAMVRAGLAALLGAAPDIEVVGEAGDGAGALEVCRRWHPDVVLMDVRMPGIDGLTAARELLAGADPPKVVMLTTFDVDDYVFEALQAGASGFLLKDAVPADLMAAVRVAAAGESLLAPSMTRRVIEHFVRGRPIPSRSAEFDLLTPREREVLMEVAHGRSNREIAEALYVAEQTIKTHVSRILVKLSLRDRVQAVIFAYQIGLVTIDPPSAGSS